MLVQDSSIEKRDTVLEIGAGGGIITEILARKAGRVIAFELDKQLYGQLVHKFSQLNNLDLHNEDFLSANLPDKPYKVFSNIPFRLTGEIVQKLLRSQNAPEDLYLIVQKEAADKLVGGSLISALYQPYFMFSIQHQFKRTDFVPIPGVDSVLLRVQKREHPLIAEKDHYENFLTYVFSRKKPYVVDLPANSTQIKFPEWIELFNQFLAFKDPAKLERIHGSSNRLFLQQSKLEKIHRTRTDKNWKKFKL